MTANVKAKRRFRFSLKMLLLLILITAVYFSYGPKTRSQGVAEVQRYSTSSDYVTVRSLAPLLIERRKMGAKFTPDTKQPILYCRIDYFVWLHGYVWQLPYTNNLVRDFPKDSLNANSNMFDEWIPEP